MSKAPEIRFVDTTLRDGNQSLWALLMSTEMMLPIAGHLNDAGFSCVDLSAPAHFKAIVRDVLNDPWERIRLVSARIPDTPVGMMQQCSITGFSVVPKALAQLWMRRLKANGIGRIHLMEASNDFGLRVPDFVAWGKEAGLEMCVALTYSISPKHSDEHFAEKARDAAALGADSLFLKDPGGLLTPERIQTIVPAIMKNIDGIPLELHSHCTTGLAPLCYIEAVKLGIRTLHTAIPPLANGSAQPSVLNMASNLRILGFDPIVDETAVGRVAEHFNWIAARENRPVGRPVEYDTYQYVHQIPGGVIANLRRQLTQLKVIHLLPRVIEETIQVRKDFGYPIMVTPFSQYMATQAALNVVTGERYKQVVDDMIHYALGLWGEGAAEAIDADVRAQVLALPRARELAEWEVPETTVEEMREKFGGAEISDDELLLRYIIGNDDDVEAMRAAGPLREDRYAGTEMPLKMLVDGLLQRDDLTYFSLEGKGISLTMQN
ncbi:MAG: hypothetical protein QF393_14760 [Rhodospirillales bacterium]|jgi:oxaloacetate decarboxylase alpha subunit|nr:hypothetical protein [Rhodospirillales bacterium]MDP6643761.1 hypothetical protein [Rhodospirillales bacterium]|tara:strand:+ start:1642 stop:3117 length:1476 start_codon:yes stop_codon:yes gene_type:complete